ncbi:MAG: hypothetical protein EBS39_07980, partial [Gammaproteobacteria bacterium]|nr:hypothetical protein [Gammaproteobacteria bacterium]
VAALRGAPVGDIVVQAPTGFADGGGSAAMQVLAAAARALTDGATWKDTVLRAVNLGGSADTVGALTGALAGARLGIDAVPAAWVAALAHRDEIAGLADRLLAEALVGLADPA